jgi:L-seryl-tRNA(Ser) seleniumtransferase
MNYDENPYRQIPSVDVLLGEMHSGIERWGRQRVTAALREELGLLRQQIADGASLHPSAETIRQSVEQRLALRSETRPTPVFNLTGTVLHTNLGRAILPTEALQAVARVAGHASDLEYDLESGERGQRDAEVAALVCELTGAEAATLVNNNAAAVLLVLNTLAMGQEVPVSRGELVEIGGSFRLPEIMARAGCRLVEVGATNRTHPKDYRSAIGDDTALLLKVHTSNYQVAGFTASVAEPELAAIAHQAGLPLVADLGSGNLVDFEAHGLPPEPTVQQVLAQCIDLVTFSGDKLLGGPQAGIIAGRADLVERVQCNPLKRAVRLDKMTLAALHEVLCLYRDPDTLCQRLPTLRLLTRDAQEIEASAQLLSPGLASALPDFDVQVQPCMSQVGSGSLPVDTLSSHALVLTPRSGDDRDLRELARRLRRAHRPVIGRVHRGSLWLDLRCLEPGEESELLEQFTR